MGAAFLNLIPKLPDFAGQGLDFATSRMFAKRGEESARRLRRREHADMVFSLKRAGLNPILAAGASPGHSSAAVVRNTAGGGSAGVGNAMIGQQQANTAATVAEAGVKKTETETANALYDRALKIAEYDQLKANTDNTKQGIQESAARTVLAQAQAEREGFSAKQIEAKTREIIAGIPAAEAVGQYGDVPGALVGAARAAKDVKNWASDRFNEGTGKAARTAKRLTTEAASAAASSAKEFRQWLENDRQESLRIEAEKERLRTRRK